MADQQQYFDRSRRPRTASANVRSPPRPHHAQASDSRLFEPNPVGQYGPGSGAVESGFNAYSVPVNSTFAYTNNTNNNSRSYSYESKAGPRSPQSSAYSNNYQSNHGSSSQYTQHSHNPSQHPSRDQRPANTGTNGSIAALSQASSIRSPNDWRNAPQTFQTEPPRQDSDSQIELVSMKKGHYEEEEEEGDDEYLDEIYQIIDAIVPRTDDNTLPALTFRVWFLGLTFGTLLCCVNTIFTFRSNYFVISAFLTVLLAYPCGIFMAKVLPEGILNPGKFNYKEHALIYVLTNSMAATPYALSNIIAQRYMLKQEHVSVYACIAFAIVTQSFGYGFAGLARRFLVRPAAMLWPSNFATIAMLNSLHVTDDISMGRYPMSRFEFFWLATSAMFFFTFLPQYVAPMLGALSVVCWFVNNQPPSDTKKMLLALGSSSPEAGMGFLSFTLDWSSYSGIFFPITTPLWAIYNQMFGTYLMVWIVVPLCFWFKAFKGDQIVGADSDYGFMLNVPYTFNHNGTKLRPISYTRQDNVTGHLSFNQEFYDENKPIYISTFFAITYVSSFVVFVSAMVHVGLWYGKDIWNRFRSVIRDLDHGDIHAQLMDSYPEVPEWWFYAWLLFTTLGAIAVCQWGGFDLPWWGVLIAIILALVTILPIGIIQAISGQQIGLNVMSEFLIGLILPGEIVAVMTFKTFCFMAMSQGLSLVQDLKLGHYIKIPPRSMFISQLAGTVFGAIISTSVACGIFEFTGKTANGEWRFLEEGKDAGWNLSQYNTFLSAGAIWGAIGPARFFGPNSPYFTTLFGFAAGIILPVIPWVMHKLQPDSFWHLINIPLITILPTQPFNQQSTLITPLIVAVIVNYFIKKYRHTWWKKYAYVMSAAFDAGSGLCILVLFFMTKLNSTYNLPFPVWFMNPSDVERCLPNEVLECRGHVTMGEAFGNSYKKELDSQFCQSVN
ncbi:OPT oligopeptide transporter protein-domain-containing protein [Obelidium mucronatum]|nr:OPT oligopeptide transporter protein-domain-containing protein [Obelidium mucronatum]